MRLVREAGKFWESFARRRVRLSVFWEGLGVWLKRNRFSSPGESCVSLTRNGTLGREIVFGVSKTVLV